MRDIKARHKQSFFGAAWFVLAPCMMMAVFTIVFSKFVRVNTGNTPYPVFVLSGLLTWQLFSVSMSQGVQSLVGNLSMVTKVYFPREAFPISVVLARVMDFLMGLAVLIVIMLLFHYPPKLTLLFAPLVLGIQLIFTLGLVLLVSGLNVFYRDVKHMTDIAVLVLMYFCPVIYPLSSVPEHFRSIYLLNPLAAVVHAFRQIVADGTAPDMLMLARAAAVSVAILITGYIAFKAMEPKFADCA